MLERAASCCDDQGDEQFFGTTFSSEGQLKRCDLLAACVMSGESESCAGNDVSRRWRPITRGPPH